LPFSTPNIDGLNLYSTINSGTCGLSLSNRSLSRIFSSWSSHWESASRSTLSTAFVGMAQLTNKADKPSRLGLLQVLAPYARSLTLQDCCDRFYSCSRLASFPDFVLSKERHGQETRTYVAGNVFDSSRRQLSCICHSAVPGQWLPLPLKPRQRCRNSAWQLSAVTRCHSVCCGRPAITTCRLRLFDSQSISGGC